MNFLFVVNSLSEFCGANVNIVCTLTNILRNKGHAVFALSKSDIRRTVSPRVISNFDSVYLLPSDGIDINNLSQDDINGNELKYIINHPGILIKGIDCKYFGGYFTKREFARQIELICQRNNIDVVIAVSSPYYLAESLAISNYQGIKALYQLDPYTNNYSLSRIGRIRRKKLENFVVKKLDILFAPNFIIDDLNNTQITNMMNKIIELNLPGIITNKLDMVNKQRLFGKNLIMCLFAGKFYEKFRNPRYLLEIFNELPEQYILHIAGEGCEKIIAEYKDKLGDRLRLHGFIEKTKVNDLINQADILINIDNDITNQMPSKIIDYIGQNKKIINVCRDEQCLSAKILGKYPNSINLLKNKVDIKTNVKKIVEFVDKKSVFFGKKEIIQNYQEYTDIFVADTIIKTIENFKKVD